MGTKRTWLLSGALNGHDIDYLVTANLQVDLQRNVPEEYLMLVGRRLGKSITQDWFARPRVYITTRDRDEETYLRLRFSDRLSLLEEEYWYSPDEDLN